ncbi:EAL domain-containing protein [Couchioplanes caeruleus]|nr:EAL domain-containing protein [Couchioplanes caeruleus]
MPSLRYAEADARAVRDLLLDESLGTFEDGDVTLLLGNQATWSDVKATLRDAALDADPADVLLVYFAGHALVPEWMTDSDAYLVTADLDATELRAQPDRGLRLTFLKRDVFGVFEGTSFLILDCCQAGRYQDADMRHNEVMQTYRPRVDRHSALLACRAGAAARESDDLRHGQLTYHVLDALRGAAADGDGRVSFARMADFVATKGLHPAPGQLLQNWGDSVPLTQPPVSRHARRRQVAPDDAPASIIPCRNPLDDFTGSIRQLLDRFFRSGGQALASEPDAPIERIRHALAADSVAVVDFFGPEPRIASSTARFRYQELRALLERSARYADPSQSSSLGHLVSEEDGRRVLFVPLKRDGQRVTSLAVVDPPLDMGEPLAVMLQAMWAVAVLADPVEAELGVLTALRIAFGRLPVDLYHHAASLHRRLMESLTMVFQPVIQLDARPPGIGVYSYEALARQHENDLGAPFRALRMCQAWGDRFVIERDSILAAKAIRAYAEADGATAWEGTRPVSINVAVRALLNDGYIAEVRAALADAALNPRLVTLEISEQDPIEPRDDEIWPQEPLVFFHRRLTELTATLDVTFAVDDFGVGYSSLARLAELPLTQIKVDRAILFHPMAIEELKLVMEVARYASNRGHSHSPRPVIVEGVDGQSPVGLHDLYGLGIQHVQGYISGEISSRTLRPLDQSLRERIAALVRGENDQYRASAA